MPPTYLLGPYDAAAALLSAEGGDSRVVEGRNSKGQGRKKKQEEKRTIVLCLSRRVPGEDGQYEGVMDSILKCKFIHSVAFGDGMLFALKLEEQMHMRAIDSGMEKVEQEIQIANKTESGAVLPVFEAIGTQSGGRLGKTFGFKDSPETDAHFKCLFQGGLRTGGKPLEIVPGVRTWSREQGFEAVVEAKKKKREDDDESCEWKKKAKKLHRALEKKTTENVALLAMFREQRSVEAELKQKVESLEKELREERH